MLLKDQGFLLDMLLAARKIQQYVREVSVDDFMNNSLVQDAVLRQLTVIGEAVKNVSEEYRAQHQEIPWKKIAGFRDVVVHDYGYIDIEEVWEIVQDDVVELEKLLEPLIPPPQ